LSSTPEKTAVCLLGAYLYPSSQSFLRLFLPDRELLTKGNKSLRTILVEAAWAATRAKGTFLQAKYHRLVKRMPKLKALGAIAHRLLVMSYHLLSRRVPYAELGTTPLDPQRVERQRRRLVEQLATLGVKVTVEMAAVAL
jgi:transposase